MAWVSFACPVFVPQRCDCASGASPYARAISQLQQSLHRRHFRHRWFSHVSFVQATQMSFAGSPQMLHENTNVFTGGAAGFCSGRGASAVFVSSAFHDIVVPHHLRS